MWRRRGEDDRSVLKYVTEDEPKPSPQIARYTSLLDGLEEVVALVVDQDKRRKINHINLPDSFHTKLGILDAFDALDVVLSKDGSRTTDGTEVETAMFVASIGNTLSTISFGKHDKASAIGLEKIYVRVHTAGSGGTH